MNRMLTIRVATALTTAFALPIIIAPPVAAQSMATNPPVEIKNNSGETRKICFHKDKKITLFAIGCVTLVKGESIFWNREGIFTPFKVKVYKKRKLIDKYLYARDLPNDTGKILIGNGGRFGFSRFKNISKKFTIRACNSRFDETIWLAIGYDLPRHKFSRGWWGLKKGECRNIGVSDYLKEQYNYPYRNIPRLYYYARSEGNKPRYWSAGQNSKLFCIVQDKKFRLQNDDIGTACGTGDEPQPYRFLAAPGASSEAVVQLAF